MSDHALLSPSSAKRWLNCPGSIRLSVGKPRLDSEFSLRGTFGHGIAAKLLLEDADFATSRLGEKSACGNIVFDEDLAGAVQVYLDAVRSVAMHGGEMFVEKKVIFSANIWGTSDAIVWKKGRPERLDVFDLKLGAGVYVDADANEQMMVYALAALAEAGYAPNPNLIDEVHLHIVQPLYTGAEAHRTYSPTLEELREFKIRVSQAEIETAKSDAPLVPGSWCRFCPARDTCPALHQQAMEGAQDIFEDLTPLTPVKAPPLLEMLSAEHLGMLLSKVAAMESWAKAVHDHAKQRAMGGEKIPGYKLIERMGHRKWTDEKAVVPALKALGVDPWAPSKLISPAAAEKLTKAAKTVTAQLAAASPSGISLVKESDRRKELSTVPSIDIFDELAE